MTTETFFFAESIRQLYAITQDEPDTEKMLSDVQAALDGGAAVIQYRNKTASDTLRYQQASQLLALTHQYHVPLIINDDAQLACDIGAAGAHIGETDGNFASLRKHFPKPFILGVSCYHDIRLAINAINRGADYIAFGRFFVSKTKPGNVMADLSLIHNIKAQYTIPVVGIGGITVDNAPSLIEAGIDSIAVIAGLFSAPDIRHEARCFSELFGPQCR